MFALKPMNCPGAVSMYADSLHSYRDLPMRMAEFGKVHRYGKAVRRCMKFVACAPLYPMVAYLLHRESANGAGMPRCGGADSGHLQRLWL